MGGLRSYGAVWRAAATVGVVASALALSASSALAAWTRPSTLSLPSATTGFPTVASNGHGVTVAAWYRFIGNRDVAEARTSTNGGQSWSPRQTLGPALLAHDGIMPAMLHAAVSGDGTAAVVFQQPVGRFSQRVVAALAPRGGRFGHPRVLSAPGIAGYPDVAFDGSNRAVVVWVTPSQVQRVVLNLRGIVARRRVIATERVPDLPAVAVNPRGQRLYAWFENALPNGLVIEAARESATGQLTKPQRLAHKSLSQLPLADAAIAPSGRSTVVYEQEVGNSSVLWAASAPWGRRFGAEQRLTPPGRFAILGGGGSGARGIGVDGAGRVGVIWADNAPPFTVGTSRMRVATSNPAGHFGAARVLQTLSGQEDFERPAIGVAPGGAQVASWTKLVNNLKGNGFVLGSAASAAGRPFSGAKQLSAGARADFPAVAATTPGGGGVAVWGQGMRNVVKAARWVP